MNNYFRILLLCIIATITGPILHSPLHATKTSQTTPTTGGSGGGSSDNEWADDFNFEEDEEEEEGLNLSRWQRLKNALSMARTKARLGYRVKFKPWVKKHKKEIVGTTAAAASLIATWVYFKYGRSTK